MTIYIKHLSIRSASKKCFQSYSLLTPQTATPGTKCGKLLTCNVFNDCFCANSSRSRSFATGQSGLIKPCLSLPSFEALFAEKASARAASYSQALPALFRPAGGRVTQLVVQNPSFSSQLIVKMWCKVIPCSLLTQPNQEPAWLRIRTALAQKRWSRKG